MTTGITATSPITTTSPSVVSQSTPSSIADIANEFASLLENFAQTANSTAQSSSAPQSPTTSSTGGVQGGNLNPGVTAYFFLSQTVSSTPAQTATTPSANPFTPASLWQTLPGMQSADSIGSPGVPLFSRLDSDQNGLLSPEEFAAAYGTNAGQAASEFASIDKNGTGNLDWSELNAAQLAVDAPSGTQDGTGTQAGGSTTTIVAMFEILGQQPSATSTGTSDTSSTTGSESSASSSGDSTSASSTQGAADASSPSSSDATTAGSSATDTSGSASSTVASDPSGTDDSSSPDTASTSGAATTLASTTPSVDASQVVASAQSGLIDALDSSSRHSTT